MLEAGDAAVAVGLISNSQIMRVLGSGVRVVSARSSGSQSMKRFEAVSWLSHHSFQRQPEHEAFRGGVVFGFSTPENIEPAV